MLAEGHEVVGCDNLIGGYLDNVPEEWNLPGGLPILKYDEQINERCGCSIHMACTAYEGLSVFSPICVPKYISNYSICSIGSYIPRS